MEVSDYLNSYLIPYFSIFILREHNPDVVHLLLFNRFHSHSLTDHLGREILMENWRSLNIPNLHRQFFYNHPIAKLCYWYRGGKCGWHICRELDAVEISLLYWLPFVYHIGQIHYVSTSCETAWKLLLGHHIKFLIHKEKWICWEAKWGISHRDHR